MKRFIPILSIAFLMAACNSKPSETETRTIQSAQPNTVPVDTAGFAQFQQWKAQNELNTATPVQPQEQPVASAPVKTVTVIREVRVKEPAPARKTVRQKSAPVQDRPAPAEDNTNTSAGNGDVATNTGSGSGTTDAPAGEGETAKKEGGWSNAKKGAVVGGAGGAVVGAVINKRNRAAGAVIGGVLGGAVGYGLGKKKDNKDNKEVKQ